MSLRRFQVHSFVLHQQLPNVSEPTPSTAYAAVKYPEFPSNYPHALLHGPIFSNLLPLQYRPWLRTSGHVAPYGIVSVRVRSMR